MSRSTYPASFFPTDFHVKSFTRVHSVRSHLYHCQIDQSDPCKSCPNDSCKSCQKGLDENGEKNIHYIVEHSTIGLNLNELNFAWENRIFSVDGSIQVAAEWTRLRTLLKPNARVPIPVETQYQWGIMPEGTSPAQWNAIWILLFKDHKKEPVVVSTPDQESSVDSSTPEVQEQDVAPPPMDPPQPVFSYYVPAEQQPHPPQENFVPPPQEMAIGAWQHTTVADPGLGPFLYPGYDSPPQTFAPPSTSQPQLMAVDTQYFYDNDAYGLDDALFASFFADDPLQDMSDFILEPVVESNAEVCETCPPPGDERLNAILNMVFEARADRFGLRDDDDNSSIEELFGSDVDWTEARLRDMEASELDAPAYPPPSVPTPGEILAQHYDAPLEEEDWTWLLT